ncbi:MAG: UDP-N-acetylmuramoyl-tripeptide--D-alanyl-D-alanine ligase [Candidatus Wallbacteria bacterium]|nr:UDP-N-acetylmuramoyl-tripeptide--D-alanyl-D-alanine ligase [Candidatus Wallbacteria bacterium]
MILSTEEILNAVPECSLIRGNRHGTFTGITTDSRNVREGDIFVCLTGENHDGFSFAEAACRSGAKALVVSGTKQSYPPCCNSVLSTPDTRTFLLKIASFILERQKMPVIMVTGSFGKTTIKEFLSALLSRKYRILKSTGNFNNNVGLPLSVFSIRDEHQLAVLEIGMNHAGEIAQIVRQVRPDYAIIGNIGPVHLEFFQNLSGIAKAKLELLSNANLNTLALINARFPLLRKNFPADYPGSVIFYRYALRKKLLIPDIEETYEFPENLRETISNYVPAILLARKLDVPEQVCQELLLSPPVIPGRFEIKDFKGVTVINDCYNANPVSMETALKRAVLLNGRKIFILGDMLELGSRGAAYHSRLGELIRKKYSPEFLFTLGENAQLICREAGRGKKFQSLHFNNLTELADNLREILRPGDVVLLKASRKLKLERLIELCFTT